MTSPLPKGPDFFKRWIVPKVQSSIIQQHAGDRQYEASIETLTEASHSQSKMTPSTVKISKENINLTTDALTTEQADLSSLAAMSNPATQPVTKGSRSLSRSPHSHDTVEGSVHHDPATPALSASSSCQDHSSVLTARRSSIPHAIKAVGRTNRPEQNTAIPALCTASFSSVSSLTSLPISSQTSSRRIVKNGVSAVTNSDSGSDDSDDGSLPDLSSFLPAKRQRLSPPRDPDMQTPKASLRSSQRHLRSNLTRQTLAGKSRSELPPSPPRPKYKQGLAQLVRQTQMWNNSVTKMTDLESEVDSREVDQNSSIAQVSSLSANVLATAASNDVDEQRRMLHALERTEALKYEETFHYLSSLDPLYENTPFPVHILPDELWTGIYRDESARVEACRTGFAAELAIRFPLPMAVTNWMAQQLMHEQDDSLCLAYLDIIQKSGRHLVSLSDSSAIFSNFFSVESSLDKRRHGTIHVILPPSINRITRLVSICAPIFDGLREDVPPTMTCSAVVDLALLNIDARVHSDINASSCVVRGIQGMLDALSASAFAMLTPEVVHAISSNSELMDSTRFRAIIAFPSGTLRSAQLRRQIALEVFIEPRADQADDAVSIDWHKAILHHMRHSDEFAINESTDYSRLLSLISVVDIAVANGFDRNEKDKSAASPTIEVGPFGNITPPSDADSEHDIELDAIIMQLQLIASRIVNVGTSHLKRTEAKSAIELLVARLEGCARSRPRRKRGIFDTKQGSDTLRMLSPTMMVPTQSR